MIQILIIFNPSFLCFGRHWWTSHFPAPIVRNKFIVCAQFVVNVILKISFIVSESAEISKNNSAWCQFYFRYISQQGIGSICVTFVKWGFSRQAISHISDRLRTWKCRFSKKFSKNIGIFIIWITYGFTSKTKGKWY